MQRALLAAVLACASTAAADSTVFTGRYGLHYTRVQSDAPTTTANTHILFMNKCSGGCTLHTGNPDNRTDTSDIPQGTSSLSQFSQSATVWASVMSCMQNVFSRFDVTITDVDPGTTPHMEVMVAGTGAQLQLPQGVLGIADFPCSGLGNCDTFMPNALVFAFANDPYYSNAPDEICATAAQEIAHTWSLDHVVDASDPMTYNNYNGIRQYKDHQACGSDCQGSQSPFGLQCTGSGGQATHLCMGTGIATQDEVATITGLFGAATQQGGDTTPPVVKITAPANNATVTAGFTVTAKVTDAGGVASAALTIDGQAEGNLTSSPFTWTAPQNLAQGAHHLVVTGTDTSGNTATATADVTLAGVVDPMCVRDSDCNDPTLICDHGNCVAGPTSPGGLGTPCSGNSDCASNECADDGQGHKYCTENCDPMASTCPTGFGCVAAAGGQGVCWPGAGTNGNNGGTSGGCNSSGSSGALLLGLGLGLALLARRRS